MGEQRNDSPPDGRRRATRAVVVGTTLRPESRSLVSKAVEFARALDARVEMIHAMPIEPGSLIFKGFVDSDRLTELKDLLQRDLERQIRTIGIADEELIGQRIEIGPAHLAIAERARLLSADLIVVGASEPYGPLVRLLGSTADRLIRGALCPVLILRGDFPVPPRRVLAPVDFSPVSARALSAGLRLLRQLGGEPPTIEVLFVLSTAQRQLAPQFSAEQIDQFAAEELARLTRDHAASWEGSIRTKIRIGDPRDQLLRQLKDRPADLVVVGTHGHGAHHRALIGSVAAHLARRSSCSVLFVPPAEEGG